MKISIIIPVYNEAATIEEILKRVIDVDLDHDKEIFVVDDGSTDDTKLLLASLPAQIKVLRHTKNLGKGTAIRTALEQITGDIVIIQDADLEYNPSDYPALIAPIFEGKTDVVYGSRWLENRHPPIPVNRFIIGGRFITWLANTLYGAGITDEATCYKVFRASLIKNLDLRCKGFEFCPEITAKVILSGYNIYEVPISYNPRKAEEGKKLRVYDGLIAVATLFRCRFQPALSKKIEDANDRSSVI